MLVYNANKAGMDGVDKEKVSKIIAENTSANFSNFSAKQQGRIDARVAEIRKKLDSVSESEWRRSQKEVDALVGKLDASRDLTRQCVHIDMDAFFAAVEMRDEPRLRDVPMAVGSPAMLSTSNYLARRCGVRAAMPGFIAKKLCPDLEIVPGNYKKYSAESKIFSSIFAEYDEDMSMGSLDEAYLDITDYLEIRQESRKIVRKRYAGCKCRLPLISDEDLIKIEGLKKSSEMCKNCGQERQMYEDEVEFGCDRSEIVKEIRFRVEQATGLTCSAGIAANFMLAKICSDLNKPNGQYELENDYKTIMKFLKDLPIRKVCGIGRVSEAHLKACGMVTVGDILEKRVSLKFAFSALSQESFLRVALGLPGRPREGDPRRKSVSVERTFSPTSDPQELKQWVKAICDELASDLTKVGIKGGRCVTLKIKLSSFDVLTRSVTSPNLVSDLEGLLSSSNAILTKELGQEMRLLGVRLSQLQFVGEEAAAKKTVLDFFNQPKRQKLTDEDEECCEVLPYTSENSGEEIPSSSENTRSDASNEAPCVNCPICSVVLPLDDRLLNAHIDECLNKDLLSQQCSPSLPLPNTTDKAKKHTKRPPNASITSFFRKVI